MKQIVKFCLVALLLSASLALYGCDGGSPDKTANATADTGHADATAPADTNAATDDAVEPVTIEDQPVPTKSPGDKYALFYLSANAGMREHWDYTPSEEGIVVPVNLEDLPRETGTDNGTTVYEDYLIPGEQTFVFAGEKPGEVILDFKLLDSDGTPIPGGTATYKLVVNDDMTVEIAESEVNYPGADAE